MSSHEAAAVSQIERALAVVWTLVVALVWVSAGLADEPAERPRPAESRLGRLVRLSSPLGENSQRRLKRAARQLVAEIQREGTDSGILILEIDSGPCDFGVAVDLARLLTGPECSGLHTVAFLPQPLTGHAVLVALACDEIALPAEGALGDAGADEPAIGPDLRSVYREIAERKRTLPVDVALGLLDRQLEVHLIETDVGREFALAERLDEIADQHAIAEDQVLFRAGEPGRLTGRQARELGLVSLLAPDTGELARSLGLPTSAAVESLSLADDWRPIRVRLQGEISAGLARRVQRLIEQHRQTTGANLIILEIDSRGGSPLEAESLANYLTSLSGDTARTLAFVPREAAGEAVTIALACDELVLQQRARLGGPPAFPLTADQRAGLVRATRALAEQKKRSPGLAEALLDPTAEVLRCRRRTDGVIDYLTRAELEQAADQWEGLEPLRPSAAPWQPDAAEVEELGLSRITVSDWDELCHWLDLADQPRLVEPSWVDQLVQWLNEPGVGWILIALGLTGLYVELHTPGLGAGGLLGGLALALLLWSKFLGGTADWLELVLFLSGVICLLIEVLILPGWGVFGLGGGLLILASLVLASQTFVWPHNAYETRQLQNSLVQLAGGAVASLALAVLLRRYLLVQPLLGSAVLTPPNDAERARIAERESLAHWDHLLGRRAEVATRLSPAGKIRVGNELVDVVSEGALVEPGCVVEVVEVHGNRVVVRPAGA